MWKKGTMNGYKYEVKAFDMGSDWGIKGGRISKLYIAKGKETVCAYERGWDTLPKDDEAKTVCEALLKKYN